MYYYPHFAEEKLDYLFEHRTHKWQSLHLKAKISVLTQCTSWAQTFQSPFENLHMDCILEMTPVDMDNKIS